jgi:hypothetical protein
MLPAKAARMNSVSATDHESHTILTTVALLGTEACRLSLSAQNQDDSYATNDLHCSSSKCHTPVMHVSVVHLYSSKVTIKLTYPCLADIDESRSMNVFSDRTHIEARVSQGLVPHRSDGSSLKEVVATSCRQSVL